MIVTCLNNNDKLVLFHSADSMVQMDFALYSIATSLILKFSYVFWLKDMKYSVNLSEILFLLNLKGSVTKSMVNETLTKFIG